MSKETENTIEAVETRLKVEVNLFRYIPLFLKETEIRLIKKEGNTLVVRSMKEGDERTFSLVKLGAFPLSFFALNLIIVVGVLCITLYYVSKAGDWVGMATGSMTGSALGVSLFYIDDFGKKLTKGLKPILPFLAIPPVLSVLLIILYSLGSGIVLYTTYQLTESLVWISYTMEFFALSVLLSPVFHYLRHKRKLFAIKEEEGFVVIAHSVIKVPKRVHEKESPPL